MHAACKASSHELPSGSTCAFARAVTRNIPSSSSQLLPGLCVDSPIARRGAMGGVTLRQVLGI